MENWHDIDDELLDRLDNWEDILSGALGQYAKPDSPSGGSSFEQAQVELTELVDLIYDYGQDLKGTYRKGVRWNESHGRNRDHIDIAFLGRNLVLSDDGTIILAYRGPGRLPPIKELADALGVEAEECAARRIKNLATLRITDSQAEYFDHKRPMKERELENRSEKDIDDEYQDRLDRVKKAMTEALRAQMDIHGLGSEEGPNGRTTWTVPGNGRGEPTYWVIGEDADTLLHMKYPTAEEVTASMAERLMGQLTVGKSMVEQWQGTLGSGQQLNDEQAKEAIKNLVRKAKERGSVTRNSQRGHILEITYQALTWEVAADGAVVRVIPEQCPSEVEVLAKAQGAASDPVWPLNLRKGLVSRYIQKRQAADGLTVTSEQAANELYAQIAADAVEGTVKKQLRKNGSSEYCLKGAEHNWYIEADGATVRSYGPVDTDFE